jgi:hypothetical protein
MQAYQKVLYSIAATSMLFFGTCLMVPDPAPVSTPTDPPQINPIRPVDTLEVTDNPCCGIFVHEDHPQEDLHLCGIQNYIALYTPTADDCPEPFHVIEGTAVTFTTLNKIVGKRGDVNMDGNFEQEDITEFLSCYNGVGTSTCLCHFDYNNDYTLDLLDVQKVQLAAGTGNSRYWASINGTN